LNRFPARIPCEGGGAHPRGCTAGFSCR
jgi:hypothetical protein